MPRWVLAFAVVAALAAKSEKAQAQRTTPDSITRHGKAIDSTKAPHTLAPVQVRAKYQKRPSVFNFFEGEPSSRIESVSPFTEWLDPFAVGDAGALLRASPDMLVAGDGSAGVLGVPGSSNQVQIGGVRVPAGLVTGTLGGNVTVSPWDVTIGGSAGATLNLLAPPAQGNYHYSYFAVRSGISGVPSWNASRGSARGLNVPAQLSGAVSGPVGKYSYSINTFLSREDVNLPRWDQALGGQQRDVLDSLSSALRAPLIGATERDVKGGVIARMDFVPSSEKRVLALTSAWTRTSSTNGDGGLVTGSLGANVVEDVGLLSLQSTRIIKQRVMLESLVSTSLTSTSTNPVSAAPTIIVTDVSGGNTLVTGGSARQPRSGVFAAEARSTGTWYSRDNATRYVMQLQARFESASLGTRDPHSTFIAASTDALQSGQAIALVRDGGAAAADASSFIFAPAIGARHDVGKNASLLFGLRADAWTASGIAAPSTLRYVDVSPRISFLQRLGHLSANRGAFATLRAGVGRFTDWPSVQQWAGAWRGAPQSVESCSGAAVPAISLGVNAPSCNGAAMIQTIGRTVAAANLRPTASNRADVSLAFAQIAPNVRGEIGAALAQTDRIVSYLSPLMDAAVVDRLSGEAGRALLVPENEIDADGVVPVAAVPNGAPDVVQLASDGQSTAEQWRVSLTTKDPFARIIWRATYVLTTGQERSLAIASPGSAPAFVTGPLSSGGRHTFAFSLSEWIGAATLRFSGIVRSGVRFTPLADRDLNGDGIANDAAYVPQSESAAWASMVPSSVRQCVRDAAGRIAGLNSCTGPWSVSSIFVASVPGARWGLPNGSEISLQVSNPLGLIGEVNGVVFGGIGAVNPVLVHITGFDSLTHQFSGQPLRGFGTPLGLAPGVVDPVRLAISVRLPLGPSVASQRADRAVREIRTDTSGSPPVGAAMELLSDIPPIPYVILQAGEGIQLTSGQRKTLQALGAEWQSSEARIVLGAYADSGSVNDQRAAHQRLLRARADFIVHASALTAQIRSLLSPDQIDLLPDSMKRALDPRFWTYIALYDAGTM